jgi:hypothetical protein
VAWCELEEATNALCATAPTTRAGAISLASYLSENEVAAVGETGHGLSLGTEQTAILLASIATAIRQM